MPRFIEFMLDAGAVRLLNTDQIAEVSLRDSDGTAIVHMVDTTVHPTKMPYADLKRLLASTK